MLVFGATLAKVKQRRVGTATALTTNTTIDERHPMKSSWWKACESGINDFFLFDKNGSKLSHRFLWFMLAACSHDTPCYTIGHALLHKAFNRYIIQLAWVFNAMTVAGIRRVHLTHHHRYQPHISSS